jgi:glucokinase
MSTQRAIGVDVGGTNILAGVVDRDGTVIDRTERTTPTASADELLGAVDDAIGELAREDVVAVGLGVPGRVDHVRGVVYGAINTPLDGVELAGRWEELGLPIGLDNDGNAAAFAEWRLGAARGAHTAVALTLGTGVGGGLIVEGRRFRGWAELGHVVVDFDGPLCQGVCTGHGHLEAFASGLAAETLARKEGGPAASAHDLIEARHPALESIGRHLGAGLASLVNIFGPDLIVIGGGFGIAAFEALLPGVREVLRRDALPPGGDVPVVRATLGLDSGLIGAGLVGFEALDEGG